MNKVCFQVTANFFQVKASLKILGLSAIALSIALPARSATLTFGNSGPDQQHGKNTVTLPPGVFQDGTGRYKIESELLIQSKHRKDKKHPYPLPEKDWVHHHALTPTKFNFSERFWILDSGDTGSEAALLPGTINGGGSTDPYQSSYNFSFYKEDNAEFVLDEQHEWTGKIDLIDTHKKLNSFGFSIDVLGNGGGFSFGWDNPNTAPFTMNFTGDADNPRFTMSYAPGFTMDNGSLFSVTGWVKNDDRDEFGRIGTDSVATVLEDTTILGNVGVLGTMTAPVYDVTHGCTSSPKRSRQKSVLSSNKNFRCPCECTVVPEPSSALALSLLGLSVFGLDSVRKHKHNNALISQK